LLVTAKIWWEEGEWASLEVQKVELDKYATELEKILFGGLREETDIIDFFNGLFPCEGPFLCEFEKFFDPELQNLADKVGECVTTMLNWNADYPGFSWETEVLDKAENVKKGRK